MKSASEKHEGIGARQADTALVARDHAGLDVDRLVECVRRKTLCFAEAAQVFAEAAECGGETRDGAAVLV